MMLYALGVGACCWAEHIAQPCLVILAQIASNHLEMSAHVAWMVPRGSMFLTPVRPLLISIFAVQARACGQLTHILYPVPSYLVLARIGKRKRPVAQERS